MDAPPAERWTLPPLDVAPFEVGEAPAARMQFSLRDVLALFVGCGVYFGLFRCVVSLAQAEGLHPDHVAVATALFWPLPLALMGLWPRPIEPPPAAPAVPGQMLWRVCGLLYPLGYLLVLAAAVRAGALWLGMATVIVLWVATLGGLLLAECGAGRRPFPAAHWLGIALYLYFLPALATALAAMLVR